MLQAAQTEVQELRELALNPTPANFQAIQVKLESLATYLSQVLNNPSSEFNETTALRGFLNQLPFEMSRLRNLMQAPVSFYERLDTIRVLHFGSYARSGEMHSLETKPFSRTVVHL
jgi:hypothetical protein